MNENLPQNLKALIDLLSTEQAIPMGVISELPFLAVKIGDEDKQSIENGALSCELKASVLNIDDNKGETVGICFVQLRLNAEDRLIYTATYDLKNEKQYTDCYELLNMERYGLFVASDDIHDFLAFNSDFSADFTPRSVLAYAKEQSSDYGAELFAEVAYAIRSQSSSPRSFWDYLDVLAPYDKKWYGRMQISKE